MKRILKIFISLLFFYVLFGGSIIPTFHDFTGADKIVVTRKAIILSDSGMTTDSGESISTAKILDDTFSIEDPEAIIALDDAFGITWDGLPPLNSLKNPKDVFYDVQVYHGDKRIQRYMFSNIEWGVSGRTPKRIVAILDSLWSEQGGGEQSD